MDLSWWFRRTLLRNNSENNQNPVPPKQVNDSEEEELLGVTDQLILNVKSLTFDTFKNFPLPEDETDTTTGDNNPTTSRNIQKDLSEWQEKHATLVLSKVKELSHLRYKLCPGYLKERQFWRVYFMLVKEQVSEYELRAVQRARLKEMAMETEKSSSADGACEVEMAEAKHTGVASLVPPTP